jgi:selenide,water dikinase
VLQPIRDTFNPADFPNLLVGLEKADDAGVYQINPQQAIITTTDFFPPVVDDPYDFGAIAAANAMSDVYAMGGEVLFAINLVAYPDNLGPDVLREILRGGAEKVAEAGAVVIGGHSVNDKEPKYGLAVTGIIDPALVKAKGGAQPGDLLLLTKPLGVGVITTALKRGITQEPHVETAVTSMKTLNKSAARAAIAANANGMTDITGFGLLGHAYEMASQAGVNFHFELASLPFLPGAVQYGEAGAFPGGMGNNMFHFQEHVTFGDGVPQLMQDMLWTPETSGGLLVALPPDGVEPFRATCPEGTVVGWVTEGDGRLYVS